MMRPPLIRFAVLVLVLSSAACKKSATVDSAVPDSSLVASLDRGPCHGTCPVYKVEIYGDGRVRFDGKQHVASMGERNGVATPAAVRALLRSAAESEFAKVDSSFVMGSAGCGAYATDLPMMTMAIKVGAQMKSVQYDIGCRNAPKILRALEAQLDTAAGTASWIAGDKK